MRMLRFVGPGDDAEQVIVETADGAERFVLTVDSALREAISALPEPQPVAPAAEPATAEPVPEPEAAIGPREIQMRVRAGASPEQLAEDHDMTMERVLRFAGPVLAERTRISDEARRARARRSTTEGQSVVFGEAVEGRFTAHGIDPSTVTWDAYRREDGQWIVTAGWLGGESDRIAEWVFHLAGRTVTPLDDTAADLLSDRPIRPTPTVDQPKRPSLVSAPPLAPGVVAFPPMPDADTGPLPAVDEVFDQDALDDHPSRGGPRRIAGMALETGDDCDAPPLPLRLADSIAGGDSLIPAAPPGARTGRLPRVANLAAASRDDETEEERAARARIPSWDDILLGVRRKSD
jgi:hypothetical protein